MILSVHVSRTESKAFCWGHTDTGTDSLRQAQMYTNTSRQKTTDGMVNGKSGEFKSGFTLIQVTSRGALHFLFLNETLKSFEYFEGIIMVFKLIYSSSKKGKVTAKAVNKEKDEHRDKIKRIAMYYEF